VLIFEVQVTGRTGASRSSRTFSIKASRVKGFRETSIVYRYSGSASTDEIVFGAKGAMPNHKLGETSSTCYGKNSTVIVVHVEIVRRSIKGF
jgi:hypothetical protein